jgi:hypothetical protein
MSGLTKAAGLPTEPMVLALARINSPTIYDDVANTGDYSGPSRSYTVQDVSAHGHRARRKITTLLDEGTVDFPLWFIPTANAEPSHTDNTRGLQGIFERGDLRAWCLRFKDSPGTAYFFNAYISKFSYKGPVAGVFSADVSLLIDDVVSTGTDGAGAAAAVFAPAET